MERERNDYTEETDDSDISHINTVISNSISNDNNSEVEYNKKEISNNENDTVNNEKDNYKITNKETNKKMEKKKITISKPPEEHQTFKPQKKKVELKLKKQKIQKKVDKMEKKTVKSEKKINSSHKSKGIKLVWIWIIIAIIVISGITLLIITLSKETPVGEITTSEVAATVNGEPIYTKDIDEQYNNLNPILQQIYTKEAILNQTIDELLLIQEAKNRNIKVSKEEIQEEISNFKLQNGLSESDFKTLLDTQNLTIKQLEGLIERRLLIKNLLNDTIFNNINITDEAIKQYYDQNKNSFTQKEQATVQHILILVSENVTDAQAKKKIQDIENELTDSNFCELTKKYSEDPGSKDTCGIYTFGRGEMVEEFEKASFNLDINKTDIVKTIYGYHLIKKLGYTPEKVQELSEVSEKIKGFLRDEAAQKNFDTLLSNLRSKATIVNYMYKTETLGTTEQSTTTTNLDNFAKCLTEKGVKMYGAYWCPHCENNKKLFGDSWKYVTYVECAVEGQPQVQTNACTAAGIEGYPTWVINGEKYPGEQSLENLARLTGCKIK